MILPRCLPPLALCLIALLAWPASPGAQLANFAKSELTIDSATGRHRFTVELAVTPEQLAQGLMFRRSMPADAGMLFEYERPQPASFWMKNTLIPLDMLFIAADGRIVNIHERAVPLSLDPIDSQGPVRAILELNGGTASRLGIKPGDVVHHPIFGNAR
jgi:uncharacterized membrane protein (UPF0127 family)